MLRIVVLLFISLLMCGCGIESEMTEDLPYYSLNKAAHESTYNQATTPHEPRGIAIAPPIPDTGWTPESIDAWEKDEIAGLDKQLADGLIDEARHAELVSDAHADAQHQRDRLLNVDYHIYSGIANPVDGGLTNRRGWEVDIVYGKTLTPDAFQITAVNGNSKTFRVSKEMMATLMSTFLSRQSRGVGLLIGKGWCNRLPLMEMCGKDEFLKGDFDESTSKNKSIYAE